MARPGWRRASLAQHFPGRHAGLGWRGTQGENTMLCHRLLALSCALSAAVPCAFAEDATPAAPIKVVHCGHLFDSVGGRMLGETSIVVRGERIESVQPGALGAPAGAILVELGDATCLPGLIDSHTHLAGETSPTGFSDQFRW